MNCAVDYARFFQGKLQQIKAEKRYRTFIPIERTPGKIPMAIWHSPQGPQPVVVWCSNDYMGLSQHSDVCDAAIQAVNMFGVGSGGTRSIAGTSPVHPSLEMQVAQWHGKDAGLLFSSGYMANEATLSTLGKLMPGCIMLSDEHNHASIINGLKASGAQRSIFRHNDMRDLESQLNVLPRLAPKVIAVVSVYSMDGDVAPLSDLADLSQKHGALLYVDEVHALGLYGPKGAGMCAALEVNADIIQGNFAKAVGVIGGYIASSEDIVDCIRSYADGFIFTTSLPPPIVLAAQKSIQILQVIHDVRLQLQDNMRLLQSILDASNIPYTRTDTHILPVVLGDPDLCQRVSEILLVKYGCYVQPIHFPTVPRGRERLRVTVSPYHTVQHIQHFVHALKETLAHVSPKKGT